MFSNISLSKTYVIPMWTVVGCVMQLAGNCFKDNIKTVTDIEVILLWLKGFSRELIQNCLLEFLIVIVDPDGDNGTMCFYFHLWLARRWQNFLSVHYWYSYRRKGYWTLALSNINTKCMSIQLAFSFQYTDEQCVFLDKVIIPDT